MQIETEIHTPDSLRKEFLPTLQGKVFHSTSESSYKAIIKSQQIKHNKDGKTSFSYPQSHNSYGRKRGYVSLFDFRIANQNDIADCRDKFDFLYPKYSKGESKRYFFILTPSQFEQLIPWIVARDEVGYEEMFIANWECWYPESIPLSSIQRVVEVVVGPLVDI